MSPIIFDSHKRWRNRQFYKLNWLMEHVYQGIREHMAYIPQTFKNVLILHPYDDVLQKWFAEKGMTVQVVEAPTKLNDMYANHDVLSLPSNSFDLIISPMNLQWVNDIPGHLSQILGALTPGGVFLAVCPGGASLHELRQTCLHVDIEKVMVAPHTSPMLEVATGAHLLQYAEFKNPVGDREVLTQTYKHVKELWYELRQMGQTNGLLDRARGLHTPRYLNAVQQEYLKQFKSITATFDILYLTGWRG